METRSLTLGQFECTTGVLVVSDPCHDIGCWCMGVIKNAKKGIWQAIIIVNDREEICELIAMHKELSLHSLSQLRWEKADFCIGVDSGQAGIFDQSAFKNDAIIGDQPNFSLSHATDPIGRWYAKCCDITLSEVQAGVLPGGTVAVSGHGDGIYDCFVVRKEDEVVGVKIVFIEDDEEEYEENLFEEDDDDEEDFGDEDE